MHKDEHIISEEHFEEAPKRTKSFFRAALFSCTTASIGLVCWFFYAQQPASVNAAPKLVSIAPGSTVRDIAHTLKDAGVIRSATVFTFVTRLDGSSTSLKAGTYELSPTQHMKTVLSLLAKGTNEHAYVSVTIPEGTNNVGIAKLLHASLPQISEQVFLELASTSEGYLFPDTYRFDHNTTSGEAFTRLRTTFDERYKEFNVSGTTTTQDIVTLASILEREGNAEDNMKLISGIIKKRLDIDMPLQADATLEYERGKGSSELSLDDLARDSPYNTYTRKGLPPTPISNPGMLALRAALEHTESDYLFYLTGKDGTFHYARTHNEHLVNKEKYLR
jgi:UPF0755 protein